MFTNELSEEFNTLRSQLTSVLELKSKTLTRMNNAVSYFDNSYENADVAYHLDWRTAVEIIEDGGDYYGAEAYEKLHPKLFITLEKEKLAMEKLSAFLEMVHIKSTTEEPWELNLEALAIKSGKIITSTIGNA